MPVRSLAWAAWTSLGLLGCDADEKDLDADDTGACSIETWEEYAEIAVPLTCQRSSQCYEEPVFESDAECREVQAQNYAVALDLAREAGCGAFAPAGACARVRCFEQVIATCDESCIGSVWSTVFDPPCEPDMGDH